MKPSIRCIHTNAINAATIKLMQGSRETHCVFSAQDDARLQIAVAQYGTSKWNDIAMIVGTKTARQCKERYNHLIAPPRCAEWTPEEDKLLEAKFQEYGPHWAKMLPWFPNRTDVNLKNRWSAILGRKCKMERLARLSSTPPTTHEEPAPDDTSGLWEPEDGIFDL